MFNLTQTRKPSPERAYDTTSCPSQPISIVCKALAKFCTMDEYNHIVSGYKRSFSSNEALIEDFMRCNVEYHEVIKDEAYYKALDIMDQLFRPPRRYRPVHYLDTRHYPWTLNTSIEAPFASDPLIKAMVLRNFHLGLIPSPRLNTHNLFDYIYDYNRNIVHSIKDGLQKGNQFFYWNKAHARSHLVLFDDPDKIRMVHGVPKLLLQIEVSLLWPYINFLRKGTTPIAWGCETFNGGMYTIGLHASRHKYKPQTWLCLDWRRFDKLARFTIIDDVHAKWKSYMVMDNGYIPTYINMRSHTNPVRIERLWSFMSKAVKFTPIRLPDGSEWTRSHSTISSGLFQTQVLDSWINGIMLITCLIALGISVDADLFIKLLGDDSLIA